VSLPILSRFAKLIPPSYLVADYERSIFQIFQRNWDPNAKQNIQTIFPPGTPTPQGNETQIPSKAATSTKNPLKLPVATIIAIAVGGSVLLTLIICSTIMLRQRQQRLEALQSRTLPISAKPSPSLSYTDPKLAVPTTPRTELPATGLSHDSPELEAGALPRFPMQKSPELNTGLMPPMHPWLASLSSGGRASLHELPADEMLLELVGSPAFEDSALKQQQDLDARRERRRMRVYQQNDYSRYTREGV